MIKAQQALRQIPVRVEANPDYQTRNQNGFAAKLEKFIYRHKNKLALVHMAMFIFFLVVLFIPPFLPEPMHGASPLNNFTEFSLFIMWGVWFPLVFVSVIFSGRSWCGLLCPLGAASEWANKVGLQRTIPRWVRWEGTPIVSFIIVTILGQTVDVRDQASAMTEIFGLTLLFALFIGFVYGKKKRAWCRHMCPIGLLLGVFSRIGAVQFAPKHRRPGNDTYTEHGICPTMIAVSQKQESRHCIECFRCVKPSSPGGLFVRFRKPGEEVIKIRKHNANSAEVWFLFLSTGVALGGFLWLIMPQFQTLQQTVGVWFINQGWYWVGNPGPHWLMSVHPEQRQVYNWLNFFMIVGFMLAWMLLAVITLSACTALASWLTTRCGAQGTFKQRFIELAYQFTPVAMISIIISLGDLLFSAIHSWGVSNTLLGYSKGILLLAAVIWSVYLGYALLKEQGLAGIRRHLCALPGIVGSALVALAWWPAIFGVNFSLLENYRHALVVLH